MPLEGSLCGDPSVWPSGDHHGAKAAALNHCKPAVMKIDLSLIADRSASRFITYTGQSGAAGQLFMSIRSRGRNRLSDDADNQVDMSDRYQGGMSHWGNLFASRSD